MNASEIIKNIEAEQLKAEVPEFHVGDTVKVYGKIKEGNRERIQVFEDVYKRQIQDRCSRRYYEDTECICKDTGDLYCRWTSQGSISR